MNKRKLLTLAMTLCMVAILAVGGTLAYFADTADQKNVFTAGNIDITLDEAVVEQDSNGDYVPVNNDRTEDDQEYDLHPGITVKKDPTIHVDEESLPTYVAAKITVTNADLDSLISNEGMAPYIDITHLVKGGYADEKTTTMINDWPAEGQYAYNTSSCVLYQDVTKADEDEWTIYMFIKNPAQPGSDHKLFDRIEIPVEYDNDKMAKLDGMEINVEAYAVQTETFSTASPINACYNAMKAAFPEAFAF